MRRNGSRCAARHIAILGGAGGAAFGWGSGGAGRLRLMEAGGTPAPQWNVPRGTLQFGGALGVRGGAMRGGSGWRIGVAGVVVALLCTGRAPAQEKVSGEDEFYRIVPFDVPDGVVLEVG